MLPNVDSVYLGDFDSQFENKFFWSWKDTGDFGFSTESIARAGVLLAYSLQALASGGAVRSQANATVRTSLQTTGSVTPDRSGAIRPWAGRCTLH